MKSQFYQAIDRVKELRYNFYKCFDFSLDHANNAKNHYSHIAPQMIGSHYETQLCMYSLAPSTTIHHWHLHYSTIVSCYASLFIYRIQFLLLCHLMTCPVSQWQQSFNYSGNPLCVFVYTLKADSSSSRCLFSMHPLRLKPKEHVNIRSVYKNTENSIDQT